MFHIDTVTPYSEGHRGVLAHHQAPGINLKSPHVMLHPRLKRISDNDIVSSVKPHHGVAARFV